MSDYKKDPVNSFVGSGNLKPEDAAMRELNKRIKDLEEENAILKRLWASSPKTRSNI